MRISHKGVDLIKHYEGCKLKAYKCPADVWTIGYGHTGGDVHEGKVITQSEADALLAVDLERFERGVYDLVTVPLNQNQFDALVSFAFNLGLGALGKSTLLKYVNNGEFSAAQKEFQKWVNAGGKPVNGLKIRRAAEAFLFASKS
jgi:lysozyme